MELIDKQELLEWLDAKADAKHLGAVYAALIEVFKEIQSGTFDDHSARKKIASLEEQRENWKGTAGDMAAKVLQVQDERNELLECLKWYADDWNYETRTDFPNGEFSNIIGDFGARARSIIAKIEGSKPSPHD